MPRSMYSDTKLIPTRLDSAYIHVDPAIVAINRSKLTDFAARFAELSLTKSVKPAFAKNCKLQNQGTASPRIARIRQIILLTLILYPLRCLARIHSILIHYLILPIQENCYNSNYSFSLLPGQRQSFTVFSAAPKTSPYLVGVWRCVDCAVLVEIKVVSASKKPNAVTST